MNVAVLGASDDPQKYAYQAIRFLTAKGHRVFPIHPTLKRAADTDVYPSLAAVPGAVHTVTLYLSAKHSSHVASEILKKAPARIIFNPGAENPTLEAAAASRGIVTLNACTLVLLKTNQF